MLAIVAAALSAAVLLLDGSFFGTLVMVWVSSFGLAWALRAIVPLTSQRLLLWLVAAGFAVRMLTALAVYFISLATGRGGHIGVDDGVYAAAASMLVDYVRDQPAAPENVPPNWAGHGYLFGPYVYLEAAIFFVLGKVVVAVEALNAAWMCAVAILLFDIARRIFSARAGVVTTVLILFSPSLVIWSALNLKDALSLFLIAAMMWGLTILQREPRWTTLAAVFILSLPLEELRRWVFYVVMVVVPIGVLVAPSLRPLSRALKWAVPATAVSMLLLATIGSGLPINPAVFENIRQGMAHGARTGYAVPPEGVVTKAGDTFIVVVPSPSPGSTAAPTEPPRTFVVAPGTRIVVGTQAPSVGTQAPSERQSTFFVQPGDTIVVSSSSTLPTESRAPQPLRPEQDPDSGQLAVTLNGSDAFERLIAYLPTGILYALFAPFPWQIGRLADLATIPDMLLWYALMAAAVVSVWRERARWRWMLAIALFALATLAVFAVSEGNTGTLFRHRAMTMPFVAVLASPVLAPILGPLWLRATRPLRRARP